MAWGRASPARAPSPLITPSTRLITGSSQAEPSFTPSSKSKTAGECAFTRCDPDVERCIKERQESGRRPRFDDGPEDAAYLHPCCLCFDATALDHRYVVYREIVRTAKFVATTIGAACDTPGGRLTVHPRASFLWTRRSTSARRHVTLASCEAARWY